MHTAYRVGRRGGRPFRGGSRGHIGNHGLRPDGSALPHNRGRGHSGSIKGVASAIPNSIVDPRGAADLLPPSSSVPGQATSPAQVPAAPLCPPPRRAWCELCKVDCNRPEILEQHKNGKRHKKNLKVHEELQKLNKVITGQQIVQETDSGSEVHMEKLKGSEEKQHQHESLPSLVASVDNKKQTELQKDTVNKSEASTSGPAEAKRKLKDPSEARSGGLKRKRGVRGGKNRKSNEGPRRPAEPPIICELCNIKCESQVVFNSHVAGRKHVANLKKFNGNQALYGGVGLQALYPLNINAPSPSFIPHIQQGLTDPQVVLAQLLTYVLSQAQVPGLAAPQVSLPTTTLAPEETPLSSSGNQYPHQLIQGSLDTSEMGRKVDVKAEADIQQHSSVAKSEASPFKGDNKAEIQTSESEKNEVNQQQSFTAKFEVPPTAETYVKVENGTLEYIDTGDKPLLSSTSEKDTITECKIVSSDSVDDSGSNVNEEEPEEDPEEEVDDDPEEQIE